MDQIAQNHAQLAASMQQEALSSLFHFFRIGLLGAWLFLIVTYIGIQCYPPLRRWSSFGLRQHALSPQKPSKPPHFDLSTRQGRFFASLYHYCFVFSMPTQHNFLGLYAFALFFLFSGLLGLFFALIIVSDLSISYEASSWHFFSILSVAFLKGRALLVHHSLRFPWVSFLYLCHILRRLLECLFVHVYSNRYGVSIPLYLCGVFYYSLSCLSVLFCDLSFILGFGSFPRSLVTIVFSIFLFLLASYEMLQSHLLLRRLRSQSASTSKKPSTSSSSYFIPHGRLFRFVSCPHYLCEILIYLSFFLFSLDPLILFVVFFVVINLSISASSTHSWYLSKFPSYPPSRRRLFPFLF